MTFTERYQNLNEKQRQAVDTIYGPVMVIAGPGSGKTELLAVRIANILQQTDANANNILCLTFTDNAAKNMRERLRKIIGQEAYKVAIHTFHTFGTEILNRYQYKLPEDDTLSPIDDISASKIFHEIREELEWDNPWKKSSQLSHLRTAINELKNEGISPHDFRLILSTNEQILNDIGPIIESYFQKINALGRKKEEIAEKMRIFATMSENIAITLQKYPQNHKTQNSLAKTLQLSLQEVIISDDSKLLTKWKNTWLTKGKNEKIILKDVEKMEKSFALLAIYEQYTQKLHENSLIDFSDMILRANNLVSSDENIKLTLAEQYQWILIDEYQDTNGAQLELITNIASTIDSPNIFAVGDDDQSIFKFQGASMKNLEIFHNLYPDTKLIILEQNYRSYQEIIDFSQSILSNQSRLAEIFPHAKKAFIAHRGTGGHIEKRQFENEIQEIVWTAEKITEIIEQEKENPDFSLSEIAVISKKNATLENIGKALMEKNIAIELSKEENIFDNEVVILLKNMLFYIHSLCHNSDKDEILLEILSHPMWNIHRLELWELSRKIYNAKNAENKIWIEALRTHSNSYLSKIAHFFIELSIQAKHRRLEDIIDILTGANELILPDDFIDDAVTRNQFNIPFHGEQEAFRSPIYEYFFSEEKLKQSPLIYTSHLANISKIIDSLRAYKKEKPRLKVDDFIEYINLIETYNITLGTSSLISTKNAVQCITGHKSKGLEYKYVFAVGLTEGNYTKGRNNSSPFPSNMTLSPEKDNNEDIERMIYTIFTRAKDQLFLTFSTKSLNEKSDSLVSVLGNISDFQKNEQISMDNCANILQNTSKNIIEFPLSNAENDFLQKIIESRLSISATGLQNFLDVTTGGPQYYLTKNLLQFPQAKHESASYGSAMHKGLEVFFQDYARKKTFNKSLLLEAFTEYITKEGFDESVEKDLIARAKDNFDLLYNDLVREYGMLHLEQRFNQEGGGTYLHDIRLTGAIDRIEITKDNTLIVTDYKTGSGFSSLEGGSGYDAIKKWKYNLQLVFYAILFRETPRWAPWKNRIFELYFIEKDKKTDEFYKITKYIQESEIERMEKLIHAVVEHIKNLNFPDVSHYSQDVAGIRQFEDDLINGII